jgi:hypothetical protein
MLNKPLTILEMSTRAFCSATIKPNPRGCSSLAVTGESLDGLRCELVQSGAPEAGQWRTVFAESVGADGVSPHVVCTPFQSVENSFV